MKDSNHKMRRHERPASMGTSPEETATHGAALKQGGKGPRIVGQDRALGLLRFRLAALRAGDPLPHVLITGPRCVGKSSLLQEVAAAHGLPVCRLEAADLLVGADGRPRTLESMLQDEVANGLTFPAIVHVHGAEALTTRETGEAGQVCQWNLASLARRERILVCAPGGRMQRIAPGRDVLLVVEATQGETNRPALGFQPPGGGQEAGAGWEEPMLQGVVQPAFSGAFRYHVPFGPLDEACLVALAAQEGGPLARLREALGRAGIVVELEPAARVTLARRALRRGGANGAEALADILFELVRGSIRGGSDLREAGGEGGWRMRVTPEVVEGAAPVLTWDPSIRGWEPVDAESHGRPDKRTVHWRRQGRADVGSEVRLATMQDLEPILRKVDGDGPVARDTGVDPAGEARGAHHGPEDGLTVPGFAALTEITEDGSELELSHGMNLFLGWEVLYRSMLIVGQSGGGKTLRGLLRICFAALRDPEASLVMVDPQGVELHRLVAAAQSYRGKRTRVVCLLPSDPKRSARWNPIKGVRTWRAALPKAQVIVECSGTSGRDDSPFFRQQAVEHLASLIVAVNRIKKGNGTLGEIRGIVAEGVAGLRRAGQLGGQPTLLEFAREVEQGTNAQTSFSTLANALQPWQSEALCEITGSTDVDFEVLAREPALFIVSQDASASRSLRAFVHLFLMGLGDWCSQRAHRSGGRLPRPLLIAIDELPVLGRIADLEVRLNTQRKLGVATVGAAQTLEQLKSAYGQHDAQAVLAGFGSVVLVPPVSLPDAQMISERCGMVEVNQVSTNAAGGLVGAHRIFRPLLLPGEICAAKRHATLGPRLLFLLSGIPPFFGHLAGAWEVRDEKEFLEPRGAGNPPAPATARAKASGSPGRPELIRAGTPLGRLGAFGAPLPDEAALRAIKHVARQIGYRSAKAMTRKWWNNLVRFHHDRPLPLLRLAQELRRRTATLTDLFLAYLAVERPNTEVILRRVDVFVARRSQPDAGTGRLLPNPGMRSGGRFSEETREVFDLPCVDPTGAPLAAGWSFSQDDGGRSSM